MVAPAAAAALSSRSSSTTTLQVIYDVHNGDKRPAALVCKIFTRYVLVTDNSFSFLTTRRCGSKSLFVCIVCIRFMRKLFPLKVHASGFGLGLILVSFLESFKKCQMFLLLLNVLDGNKTFP